MSRRGPNNDTTQRTERYDGEPNVQRLLTDYRHAVEDRDSSYWERMRVNYETRYCLWANQSWDGRKWKGTRGRKPFPWSGASDARVPLADKYVREDVAVLMQIWANQKIMVRATRAAQDAGWANRVTQLLRWQIYEEMEEAEPEAELLANIMLERGSAALQIWWCKEEQKLRETVEMEQVLRAAEQARQALAGGRVGDALELQAILPQLLMDPSREKDVAALLSGVVGEAVSLDAPRWSKVVRDLRTQGVAHFPRTVVVKDRPMVRALVWNEDVVIPPECQDLQRSRVLWIREMLTETDLAVRARSYDYDPNWVDAVVETQRGKNTLDPQERAANRATTLGRGEPDTSQLFEIVTAYERLYDEDNIPGLYSTVFNPGLRADNSRLASYGKHELLDYAHGKFPVEGFSLERRSRLIDDARGYGERAHTWQQGIKRQWDARVDRADVATLPPSYHPTGEEPDAWGPGVKIPTDMPDKFGYFDPPAPDAGSREVEETVRKFADEYFGRTVDDQNVVEARAMRQDLARGWLMGWKRAGTQILQLDQQYLPEETWVRVVGDAQGRGLRVSREEIQGPFNLMLKFNAADLDPEYVQSKVELLTKALTFDVGGRLDRDEALLAILELVDPSYAERLIKSPEAATLEQVDDEQTVLTKLMMGIGVDVKGNEAFALRRQVLEQTIRQSPTIQKLLQVNPDAAELVKGRVQQLDFNIQQKLVNPDIGRRLGSQPMSATSPSKAAAPAPATP